MIRIEGGMIMYEGTTPTLLAELSTVMEILMNKGVATEEDLHRCAALAALDPQERREMAAAAEEAMETLFPLLFGEDAPKPKRKNPSSRYEEMMAVINEVKKEMEGDKNG